MKSCKESDLTYGCRCCPPSARVGNLIGVPLRRWQTTCGMSSIDRCKDMSPQLAAGRRITSCVRGVHVRRSAQFRMQTPQQALRSSPHHAARQLAQSHVHPSLWHLLELCAAHDGDLQQCIESEVECPAGFVNTEVAVPRFAHPHIALSLPVTREQGSSRGGAAPAKSLARSHGSHISSTDVPNADGRSHGLASMRRSCPTPM